MARVVVTVPGERVVEEFDALVERKTVPPGAPPPSIGLVEISQRQATELIPGPPGPQGTRGSRWFTGTGAPGAISGQLLGDQYLDNANDEVWQFDGTAWFDTGTNIHGSPDTPADVLAKLITVDGAGSGLDADMVDGEHAASLHAWANLTGKPATFPPTLPIAQADVTNLVSDLALKAPLASPGLTGTPTAPTASAGTNTIQIASTAFVGAAVAAQAANEYDKATADARFVNVSGDTMTGTLTLAGDPSTALQAATKAYVDAKPAGAVISDTPPASPSQGQTWWESDSGAFYIWYNDGTSAQWVQVNAPSVPLVRTADSYNRIVNGAMQISQENGSTSSPTTASNIGYYAADQWMGVWSLSVGTAAVSRFAGVTPSGSANFLLFNCVAAATSLAANDYATSMTRIEGIRVADLGWGAAGAKQVVLRFWSFAPAGTYSVAVRNSALDRTYLATFTQLAAAWEMKTVVIPGDVTGTWLKDTGVGLQLAFCWAVGTGLAGPAGWQAGNKLGVSGQASTMPASTNYSIADVGLYLDPNNTGIAPPWVMPDYGNELAVCKRYWYLIQMDAIFTATAANQYSGFTYPFPVTMRTNAVMTQITGGTATNAAFATVDSATSIGCRAYLQAVAAGNCAIAGRTFAVSARM
jgi:hypothetical protein